MIAAASGTLPRAPFVVEPVREVHLLCPLRVRGGDPDLDAATLVRSLLPAPGASSPLWLVGQPGSGRRCAASRR